MTGTVSGVSVSAREIRASDGYPLAATLYYGAEDERPKVAILNAAMGVRRERYEAFARYLAGRGWVVVTYDYRGIGGSRRSSLRGSDARLLDWGEKDLAGVIEWVCRHWNPERCLAIGHSVGGQILGLAPNHRKLDAALLVASPKGFTKYWDGVWKGMVHVFWRAIPLMVRMFGRLPMGVAGCADLPPQVALDWRRWALHPDFVDEHWESLAGKYRSFTAPILSISFADDRLYAPFRAVRALLGLYLSAPSQHWHFRPEDLGASRVGHSGFFDAGVCPRLWEHIGNWLDAGKSANFRYQN